MGTRGDFYIGRGKNAEWIGSIAYDAHAFGGKTKKVSKTKTEKAFRSAVAKLTAADDGTTPDLGWPWPWDNSATTDECYAFDQGQVWVSSFGRQWLKADMKEKDMPLDADGYLDNGEKLQPYEMPDMSAVKNVTLGPRSGVLIFGIPKH